MTNKTPYFPMNVAELLDTVFAVYKKTFFAQIARIMIISSITSAVYFVLVISLVVLGIMGALSFSSNGGQFAAAAAFVAAVLLIAAVACLTMAANSSAGMLISSNGYRKQRNDVGVIAKKTLKSIINVFTAYLFTFILYIPFAAVLLFCAYLLLSGAPLFYDATLAPFTNSAAYEINAAVAVVLLFFIVILAVGAFIFIQTLTSCSVASALFEEKRFFSAFSRSLALTEGSRFKIAATLTLWSFVSYITSYSITALFSITTIIQAFADSSSNSSVIMIVSGILQYGAIMVTTLLMAPFSDILYTLIYYNQRIKKEGYNIVLELEQPDDTV